MTILIVFCGLPLAAAHSPLLASVRKDHELDRVLLEKRKRRGPVKKPKRGDADDPFCRRYGDYIPVIGEKGPENLCRFRNENPCPRCGRSNDSK
jgi:hypothetical protein